MMEMSFIEKFIDDPLSYCPLWNQDSKKFLDAMAKISDTDPGPMELPDKCNQFLTAYTEKLNLVNAKLKPETEKIKPE